MGHHSDFAKGMNTDGSGRASRAKEGGVCMWGDLIPLDEGTVTAAECRRECTSHLQPQPSVHTDPGTSGMNPQVRQFLTRYSR